VETTFWLARRDGKPFITGNTFPPALVVKPLLAMCPERVCRTCGEPSRRITGEVEYVDRRGIVGNTPHLHHGGGHEKGVPNVSWSPSRSASTLGWTDCSHNSWRSGIVLDPFAGSGTVLSVASGHGRDSIGIDLDERNAELARQRVGMFLTVEYPEVVA
jgi:hypothetical protein